MKKLFLIILILLLPVLVKAGGVIMMGGSASPSGGATILWSESFEGTGLPTGFATLAGTPDYDDAGPGSLPDGGGSQCLQLVASGSALACRYTYASDVSKSYTRFYIYVDSNATNDNNVIVARDSTAKKTWELYLSTTGPIFYLNVYTNGAAALVDTIAYNLDQWYRVEILYDVAGTAWEWKIGGTSAGSGALAGNLSAGFKDLTFGFTTATHTIYWDLIALSNDGWIGP